MMQINAKPLATHIFHTAVANKYFYPEEFLRGFVVELGLFPLGLVAND